MVYQVKVYPRSKINDFSIKDSIFHIRFNKKPTAGEANKYLISLISKYLEIPRHDILILSGARSRYKLIEIPLSRNEIERQIKR